MGKNSFQFKQFTVVQDLCAMKVGTDGTLLGAWADAPIGASQILDIGTGTGLIALMMAQRFPEAQITGIDIDADATKQAQENIAASPFANRIMINKEDVTKITDKAGYDAIVCNPPYFVDSLTCPQDQRTLARHTVSLTYESLMHTASQLLKTEGILSLVIPSDNQDNVESAAAFEGLFLNRICLIKTTPNKLPKRHLVEFRKHPVEQVRFEEQVLETSPGQRSEWYNNLTKDFYIR
ncbi:tRNA1(Val) (adenine(37)-N6)-methyltransferase [Prevotella sp. MA2016]|uniref:tRNA1(Val) (adenine(37)-N6)-methyltransferase n=1 Tax=Prevotella sp. MA2016 TaxID=1408310 RepID=UPI00048B7DC4|nr:methyltransferase [Prevotella sp. MA2016]